MEPSDLAPAGKFVAAGAALAALSVALGAFGAHGLKEVLNPADMETFQTAVRYQSLHALGIVLIGILLAVAGGREAVILWLNRAGVLLGTGIVIFSGSLYLLLATGQRWLGAVTPLGGVAFILGWVALGAAGLRMRRLPRREA
ncbi:MAG: DUF423 domain-containing protein [Rhodothermales bacterium]|nr:DUF423 domain-containing protein [Rhodothermales bacterium]